MKSEFAVIAIVAALIVGAVAGYFGSTTSPITMTLTTTATVTTTVGGTNTATAPVVTNGSASVEFLDFGLNGTTIYSSVRNVGDNSLKVASVIVNGRGFYFNSNGTILTVSQNPIPPNGVAVVAATSPFNACSPPSCSFTFTIVTDQGLMLTHYDYFVGGISTTTTTPTTSPVVASCQVPFQHTFAPPVPVLVLSSGATGVICVKYTNSFGNNLSSTAYSGVWFPSGPNNFSPAPASSISIAPNPTYLNFESSDRNQSYTVEYTVHVASNLTGGIYGALVYQICTFLPIAVGSSRSNLTSSDFNWYNGPVSCPAQVLQAQIVGIGGFNVAYAP